MTQKASTNGPRPDAPDLTIFTAGQTIRWGHCPGCNGYRYLPGVAKIVGTRTGPRQEIRHRIPQFVSACEKHDGKELWYSDTDHSGKAKVGRKRWRAPRNFRPAR